MKKIICFSLIVMFLTIGLAIAGTVNLPKTGQTKCYDTAGLEIPCAGTGQDGEIQAGVAWPDPRFTDNGDGTMTDNLTGLMWTKDANLPGGTMDWQQALDYVAAINAGTYPNFGHTDWRLPNVNEMESIINANEANSATWLNNQGFTNVQADGYWSSTTFASYLDHAWVVYMWYGDVDTGFGAHGDKSLEWYVWPVRGGQQDLPDLTYPANVWKTGQTVCYATGDDGDLERGVSWPVPRFADHGNGTVTDNLTGLIWTKNAVPSGYWASWQMALNYVATLNANQYLGYTDWQVPNRKELFSLIDHSRYAPVIPTGHPFTNIWSDYWSSTTYAQIPDQGWLVSIWGGAVYGNPKVYGGLPDYYAVWPVRGPEPTVIALSSFTATPSNRKVILNWTTASEIDNAGFNLYRAESEDGEYVKINDSLIPAEGSPTRGATYEFVDDNVQNRKTYFYKLEDIDLNGTSTMHGPVSVEPKRIAR